MTVIREVEVYLRPVEDTEFSKLVVDVIEEQQSRLLKLRPGGIADFTTSLRFYGSAMSGTLRASFSADVL